MLKKLNYLVKISDFFFIHKKNLSLIKKID